MDIINKTISVDKTDVITVESIEQILTEGTITPLRWSIVESNNDKITIDAVLIEK
jgi:hypothetical protein